MYRFENVAEMYHEMSKELLNNGTKVCPRGNETKEILTPVIQIENPGSNLAYLPERKFNVVYALVESLMLLQKKKDTKYFTEFNARMGTFSDDGTTLNGAYGYRIAENIDNIVNRLKEDKDTRQAIVNIYNNDISIHTKDTPCTIALHFIIRDNKLNMITYMRSNDIIWGTPYDMFMFTNLQRAISLELWVGLGWYRHIPTSLHVYKDHYDLLDAMKDCESIPTYMPFDTHELRIIGQDYIDFVDDGKIHNTKIISGNDNLIDIEGRKIRNIIYNEKCYRDKIWASENSFELTHDVPFWTDNFTKRWWK